MNRFEQYCPTKVIFGSGSLQFIHSSLPSGCKKALLVSSKTAAKKSGAFTTLSYALAKYDVELLFENNVSPNPRLEEVDFLSSVILENDIDAVIAVGGGSVIDAAKAAALCAGKKITAKELLSAVIDEITPIFLIAVPTTAGTGSEVSKGAIVTDQSKNWKGGVRGNKVFPKVAILDPDLTKSLPVDIVLETGFDVVTHAFESLLSKASTPITDMYSRQALELAIPALLKVARVGSDAETRNNLMYASLLAGYNLANSSTCLPHRLQYPLGAHTDSSHARGLASLYPAWVESTYPYATENIEYLANIIGESLNGKSVISNKESVVSIFKKFLLEVKMSHKMRDFGVKEEDCKMYAEEVDGNLALDPGRTNVETLIKIYRESW
jgi:alcohol dehydrogenase class IV